MSCCKKCIPVVALSIVASLFFGLAATPKAAQADDSLTLEGWLTLLWGDDEGGASIGPYFRLTDEEQKSTELIMTEEARKGAGDILSLNGKYVGVAGAAAKTATADGGEPPVIVTAITALPQPGQAALEPDGAAGGGVSGAKPWVSIMCKFSDHSEEPQNLAYFQNMYSSTKPGLDHYWREVSYNTVNVSGSSAAGWYVLPHAESYYNPTDTQGGADLDKLADDCIAAANNAVDFSLYSGINMMFNTNFDNGFAWGGTRYLSLDGVSRLWYVTWEPPWGYGAMSVMAHEMGHGFGLPHSSGEYGQTYDNEWDVMSDSWANCPRSTDPTYGCLPQHTISYHKDRLGWIPAAQFHQLSDNSSVVLTMEQLALPATASTRMVKIPIAGASNHYYTVEARRQTGYDYKLPGQGIIIHEVDTSRSIPAHVLDPDGDGDTGDGGAIWEPGETFNDEASRVMVEVLSATATGYTVEVTLGTKPGDVNDSRAVGLEDAILALQIISGCTVASGVTAKADVDGDTSIGLSEAVFALQKTAGN